MDWQDIALIFWVLMIEEAVFNILREDHLQVDDSNLDYFCHYYLYLFLIGLPVSAFYMFRYALAIFLFFYIFSLGGICTSIRKRSTLKRKLIQLSIDNNSNFNSGFAKKYTKDLHEQLYWMIFFGIIFSFFLFLHISYLLES